MAKITIVQRGNKLHIYKYINRKKVSYSTGLENTTRNFKYLEKNKESEFDKLHAPEKRISVNFNEYAKYVIASTKFNRSENSQKEYLQKLDKLIEFFKKQDVTTIKYSDLSQWQNYMISKGFKAKTIIGYRTVLNIVLQHAYLDEIIERNPMEKLKAPKIIKELPHAYSVGDIKKIVEHSVGQFANLVLFAFYSGMRPGEIIALEWNDINLETNTIRVTKRIRDGKLDLPKGYKARVIDLLPNAKQALLKQQIHTGLKKNVFVTQYGKPYNTPETLDTTFKKVCARAGVKVDRFYNTKHTFVTMMLENNMNETWLTQQLGHTNIDVTRKHYASKIKPNFDNLEQIAV